MVTGKPKATKGGHNLISVLDQRFGKLIVSARAGSNKEGKALWKCACDCGNEHIATGKLLRSGETKSCGCLIPEATRLAHLRKEYVSWCGAKSRCYRKKDKRYSEYGGRGITVCERWRHSFENFIADMGLCPEGCSIDRIDVNGNYEPTNCRWANAKTQGANRRCARILTVNGKSQSATKWAEELGIPSNRIFNRLHKGWAAERAIVV